MARGRARVLGEPLTVAMMNPLLVQAMSEVGIELSKVLLKRLPQFARWRSSEQPPDPIERQVAELQAAVRDNAESIRTVAEELKKTVAALERGIAEVDTKMKRVRAMATVALAATVAASIAVAVLFLSGS